MRSTSSTILPMKARLWSVISEASTRFLRQYLKVCLRNHSCSPRARATIIEELGDIIEVPPAAEDIAYNFWHCGSDGVYRWVNKLRYGTGTASCDLGVLGPRRKVDKMSIVLRGWRHLLSLRFMSARKVVCRMHVSPTCNTKLVF